MNKKTHIGSKIWITVVFLVVILLPNGYANAYLDPGTGSFILQIVVAGILGSLMFIRLFSFRIVSFGKKLLGKGQSDSNSDIDEI